MGADTKICLEIIHKRKVSLLPSGPGQVGSPGDEVILSELQYSQLIGCDGLSHSVSVTASSHNTSNW